MSDVVMYVLLTGCVFVCVI